MFAKLRRARTDLATMHALFPAAERIAREDGNDEPGAEHLLLAALELDDGVARAALGADEIDSVRLRTAISAQHEETLRTVGIVADDNAIAAALPPGGRSTGVYRSQGSLQTAFQRSVDLAKAEGSTLTSGHILLAVIDAEHGTVVRTLDLLGVDPAELRRRVERLHGALGSSDEGSSR
jgi:ATP-dependent Clp protease ATP-binding subunit ClpA